MPECRSALLATRPTVALAEFLRLIEATLPRVDCRMLHGIATQTIRYLNASERKRATLRVDQSLEQRWYAALATGVPDYGVYGADAYLAELWACWSVYSRRYLLAAASQKALGDRSILADLGPLRRVVDLGCGFGYTCAALRELTRAAVIGTNLSDTVQMTLARKVGARYGFEMTDRLPAGPVDLVFASEYFEHIEGPIAHLRDVLALRPRALLVANAFGAKAVGHFDAYVMPDGTRQDGATTAKRFSAELRQHGYARIKTKMWNNRPSYWRAQS